MRTIDKDVLDATIATQSKARRRERVWLLRSIPNIDRDTATALARNLAEEGKLTASGKVKVKGKRKVADG